MATVIITGGTGMIGRAVTKELLNKGYQVIILTREATNEQPSADNISYAQWNIEQQTINETAIKKADFIIHLAGANVAESRWTDSRKNEIRESRTKSGALLCKALTEIPNGVKAVISASAIGWYGADPQIPNPVPFTERDPPDVSFLGSTCQQWEKSVEWVQKEGKRLVIFRIGIVLSTEGGAFAEFEKPTRFGATTILGNGKQIISWIHIQDLVQLFITAIENEAWKGTYNAVAPAPVSNRELMLQIKKAKGSLSIPVHVPQFILKAMLGEMSVEVLKSATVSHAKVEDAGYQYLFPDIGTAVYNLMKKASG